MHDYDYGNCYISVGIIVMVTGMSAWMVRDWVSVRASAMVTGMLTCMVGLVL